MFNLSCIWFCGQNLQKLIICVCHSGNKVEINDLVLVSLTDSSQRMYFQLGQIIGVVVYACAGSIVACVLYFLAHTFLLFCYWRFLEYNCPWQRFPCQCEISNFKWNSLHESAKGIGILFSRETVFKCLIIVQTPIDPSLFCIVIWSKTLCQSWKYLWNTYEVLFTHFMPKNLIN